MKKVRYHNGDIVKNLPTSFWTLIRDKNDKNILGTEKVQFIGNDLCCFFADNLRDVLYHVISHTKSFTKFLWYQTQLFYAV